MDTAQERAEVRCPHPQICRGAAPLFLRGDGRLSEGPRIRRRPATGAWLDVGQQVLCLRPLAVPKAGLTDGPSFSCAIAGARATMRHGSPSIPALRGLLAKFARARGSS